ncbi:MAG: xylulokinase [Actinomycetota bacterium]|nr:xylulokinase [Actinomycetota bacterium]
MGLVVGVDSSTSACKVEVRDADSGALVASGRAPHPPTSPPRSEQDPASWYSALEEACAKAGVGTAHRPVAISVAGQQHGLVVLDGQGRVLRPAKLWNDTESAPDAAELVETLGPQAWATSCGSVPVASFTVTKLKWLRRTDPEIFDRVATVLLPHDWLTWRLTGRFVTDRGDASGTGYWSPAEGRYRLDLLELVDRSIDWAGRLPEVLGPDEPAGDWSAEQALVGPGTGDNMAGALGAAARPGDLVLSLGTSGTAYTVAERPSHDPTGTVAGFADATGRFLPLVCTLNATKVTDWMAGLLGLDLDRFDALAASAGSGGVVVVPHFDGERTPNRPLGTGLVTGLRPGTTAAHLGRAAVEGVVCNLLAGAAALPATDGRVLLVGGGARSRAYRQVVADLTGRAVVAIASEELVARGAAVQAAAVSHGRPVDEVAAAWGESDTVEVEPAPGFDADGVRQAYAAAVEVVAGGAG